MMLESRMDFGPRLAHFVLDHCLLFGTVFRFRSPAFNRDRLKAEKLIDSKVLEQLIRVQVDAGCSRGDRRADFRNRRQSKADRA